MKPNVRSNSTLLRRIGRLGLWIIGGLLLVSLGAYAAQAGWLSGLQGLLPSNDTPQGQVQTVGAATGPTAAVTIRPATQGAGSVSASGNLELTTQREVVVEVSGLVGSIYVDVGDTVEEGELLAALDSRSAEEAVQDALLNLAAAQVNYDSLLKEADANDVAAAQAKLTAAQAKLTDLQAGASAQEIAAAQSALAAAQAGYTDLQDGPTAAKLVQLSADIRTAEVTLAEAQGAYNKVAWRNDVGMTGEAAELQSATIAYEKAQAAYEESTAPASEADRQNALSNIQSAQKALDDLLEPPSTADIASAEAEIASAQSSLDSLLKGADEADLASAQLSLAQAQLALESAAKDLSNTELRAPIAGAVLSVDIAVGRQVSNGTSAMTLADINQLQLTVNVAESDIEQLIVGMPAEITLDALPGKSFAGEVLRIAPSSDPAQSVVNYPVTIQLTDDDLSGVRSGMTAVATMQSASLADAWLVPVTALSEVNGAAQVTVIRNGAPLPVTVEPGSIQGEWIVVESPELQEGDQIAGSVATYVNEQDQFNMPGGPMTGGGGPPPDAGGGSRPGQ